MGPPSERCKVFESELPYFFKEEKKLKNHVYHRFYFKFSIALYCSSTLAFYAWEALSSKSILEYMITCITNP